MLARNFKTAAELGLKDEELAALEKTLRAFEREEVIYTKSGKPSKVPNGFNMGPYLDEGACGTTACIAGWAHLYSNRTAFGWVDTGQFSEQNYSGPIFDLFHAPAFDRTLVRPEQAARALRNFLTSGEARWADVMRADD